MVSANQSNIIHVTAIAADLSFGWTVHCTFLLNNHIHADWQSTAPQLCSPVYKVNAYKFIHKWNWPKRFSRVSGPRMFFISPMKCWYIRSLIDLCCLLSQQKDSRCDGILRFVVIGRMGINLSFVPPRRWDLLCSYFSNSILIPWAGAAFPAVYNLTGCYPSALSNRAFLMQIPPIATEACLCACMLYKGWTIYKLEYGSPLLTVLIRDRLVQIILMQHTRSMATLTFGSILYFFRLITSFPPSALSWRFPS